MSIDLSFDAASISGQEITLTYRNWRGEVAQRRILPKSIRFGTTDWHPEPGWLLLALDLEKNADREFALADCDFTSGTISGKG